MELTSSMALAQDCLGSHLNPPVGEATLQGERGVRARWSKAPWASVL